MRLKDKVAVITGAGRGIGQAIAEAMAKEEAKLVLIDIAIDERAQLVKSIEKAGGEAMQLQVDISSGKEIKEAVENIVKKFGRVDILVNNAGIGTIENFWEGNEGRWNKMIDVNLIGLMLLSKAVLPGMIERRYGKIVNIASGAALSAAEMQTVYAATKGGVVAFTKSLAAEVARYHINVNSISPGLVITPMTESGKKAFPDIFSDFEKNIPWGRPAQPADIAKCAIFLSSEESEYITGQNILVDGGLLGK